MELTGKDAIELENRRLFERNVLWHLVNRPRSEAGKEV